MKNLVIYHDHCTDGFGAAFAAEIHLSVSSDRLDYLPADYGRFKTFNDLANATKIPLDEYDTIYVLDFSFDKEITEKLISGPAHFVWLDHHKSAFEMWAGDEREKYASREDRNYFILLDNNKSGARLAWEYFSCSYVVPDFIEMIDDRDRWQFKNLNSKAFHAALQTTKPWSFEGWAMFAGDSRVLNRMIERGEAILTAQNQLVESLSRYSRRCEITHTGKNPETGEVLEGALLSWNSPGLAVNSSVHMSEVGHVLATNSGSYGMLWYLGKGTKAKVSLRSNGTYDVSEIAKCFGGGGHRNAAGFEVEMKTLLSWLK